ncbi:MAG: HAD family phosphatase [Vitreimonas sp.]
MSLPRSPKAVVFDLDGTLIDSEALVREAYFTTSGQFGVALSDAQFLSLVGLNRDDNDVQLRGYWGADFPLENFHTANRAFLLQRVAPLKPGAVELLDALDDVGAPYALATSSGPPWVERHFTAYKLADRFKAVITRADCTNGKPHPEPYLKASAALSVAPTNVLALEDSHAGVRAAHAAGCMTIMIPDLLAPNEEMHAKALHVLADLHGVRELMLSSAPANGDR